MRQIFLFPVGLPSLTGALLMSLLALPPVAAFAGEFHYPDAPKGSQVDDYHGTKVADPYRWLEDADSPETQAWVEAENKLTFGYLRQIPARARIHERVTELWDYEKFGVPHKEGGQYFFSKNTGLQNQSVIYTAPAPDAPTTELLDPNKLSGDGTVSLSSYEVSDDGRYVAYGLNTSGSDWISWRVKDVATGKDLPDKIEWAKFSGASWSKDGQGFFYSRYDEPEGKTQLQAANYFQKIRPYRL